jgi:hypothetical protein
VAQLGAPAGQRGPRCGSVRTQTAMAVMAHTRPARRSVHKDSTASLLLVSRRATTFEFKRGGELMDGNAGRRGPSRLGGQREFYFSVEGLGEAGKVSRTGTACGGKPVRAVDVAEFAVGSVTVRVPAALEQLTRAPLDEPQPIAEPSAG